MLKKLLIVIAVLSSTYLIGAEISAAEQAEISAYIIEVETQRDKAISALETARQVLAKDAAQSRKKRMKYLGMGFAAGTGAGIVLTTVLIFIIKSKI